jgi:hypothetical protein
VTWSYAPGGDQTGFQIQRATNPGFTQGLQKFNVAGNVFTYSDKSTKPGVVYYYQVAATNDLGIGVWSNTVPIVAAK